ncbi:hypothetical protein OEZ85_006280 [Tetradesmus obliquus]|uniref:Vacuolar protein sorting-associated protein 13 VPS13 adaptor binding domain-containing protein n=1 Tax=Tetradesmus obliquus TaxID=3088 RepID=A0ABY8TW37_TETOB|nr:hypothetical protein OEZ85_006280 [Tetradesmus obliquus]
MEQPYWLEMSKAEKKARAARASAKQRAEQQHNRDADQEPPDAAQQYHIDDTPMRTKELLALLVLGTSTSVRKVQAAVPSSSRDADGAAAAAAAAADAGSVQPGLEVAVSVAHIGLQDLRACVEQRHVLSGALEPYQASTPCTPVSPLRGDAACHIAAEVVVPAGGGTAEQPMLLSVSVHNPRLVLVRRFVNNVVYVMGLVNHEVVAAGSSRRAAAPAGRASAAAGRDAPPAASSAVVLVSITNAQVILPHSHASKQLFAGRMVREQDMPSVDGTAFAAALLAQWAANAPNGRLRRCTLTDLTHMITRTDLRAAFHEYSPVVYAAAAASPAGAAAGAAPAVTSSAAAVAAAAIVVALAAPDGLALHMSGSSYRVLMDMVFNNLMMRFNAFVEPPDPADPSLNWATGFNPALRFGPRPGQLPSFGVTLSSSTIQATLFADKRWWNISPPAPQQQQQQGLKGAGGNSGSGSGTSSADVQPFVSASLQEAGLCVQMMQKTWDMHVNLWSADTEWVDVRMANSSPSSFPRQRKRHASTPGPAGSSPQQQSPSRFGSPTAGSQRGTGVWPLLGSTIAAASEGSCTDFSSVGDAGQDVEMSSEFAEALKYKNPDQHQSATINAANIYSRECRTPQQQQQLQEEEEDAEEEEGSAQRESSDEGAGEQQLGTYELYPSLLRPSADGADKGADVSIIRVLDELPAEESAHLSNKGKRSKPAAGGTGSRRRGGSCPIGSAAFKLHFGYLKEGTMQVEVSLANTLVQWPYLADLGLVAAIINVFYSDWGAAPQLPPAWLQLRRNPWLYFNLVITDSQIFLPLLTPHVDSSAAGEQQNAAPSPFAVLRDVVLRQGSNLTAEDIEKGKGQPMEQLGVALTFGAFRFGYFYGGDGEAIMRADVRNLAGFIRDRSALITNWLLPLPSAKLELRQEWPMVEEHRSLLPLLMHCRWLRFKQRVRLLHRAKAKMEREARRHRHKHGAAGAATDEDAASELQLSESILNRKGNKALGGQDNASGSYATSAARAAATAAATPEQRLLALACEHAEELFGERVTSDWHNTWARQGHSQPLHTGGAMFGQSSSGMFGVYKRKARSELLVTVAPITLRAAFSNIRTWNILQADMQLAGQSMSRGLGMWPPRPDIQQQVLAVRAAGGTWPPPPTGWAAEFRRSSLRCTAELAAVVLMLCDDKPQSFGAPDVLQVAASGVSLVHATEARFPRTQPERAGRLHVEGGLAVNILNNSNSKWEVLLEPWPLLVSLCDPINPLAKADRTLYGQVLSSEPMRVNFHPSSLLSIGDLLAFMQQQQPQAPSRRPQVEAAPSIEQQMALAEGVTSRIPQRYLIQNLCGSHLWYWSYEEERPGGGRVAKRRVLLPAHSMQELKVAPAPRQVRHLAADGSLVSSGMANAISVQLAGSWLPLEDMAVDVVGKYRYDVRDPLGGPSLPLLLDVLLVGRTKMLRLHSCIWLQNNTSMRLQPCIQLGAGCRTPVVLAPGDKLDAMQRLHLRALKPKEGRFLPAAAALGGLLFLAPDGHFAAEHDVLQLQASLLVLKQQQGYITCQSKPDCIQTGPLHLAASVHLGLQSDPYFTTQNLVEVPRPGTLRRARLPLEASIHISPTLQFTNGLPYDVLGWALVPPGREFARSSIGAQQGSKAAGRSSSDAKQGDAAAVAAARSSSLTGEASIAGAAAAAAVASAAGAGPAGSAAASQLSGLQLVWAAKDRREAELALSRIVAAASSPEQALQQQPAGQQAPGSPVPGQAAHASRLRRNSFGFRWCREVLLHEFLTTLHLVLSPAMAAAVDVMALQLLDLPSLVALALGVLAEEFGWIAKSFPQAFSLILKVEEAMEAASASPSSSTASSGTSTAAATPGGNQQLPVRQLPWPADELPIVELLSLLHWLQQHVVRLQLAPGGCADLYLNPDLEVYAAVRLPLLAMQSRPTLISGGSTGMGGADTLRLFYTKHLDIRHVLQQHASLGRTQSICGGGSSNSLVGQPRLGLAGLDAMQHPDTVHEEVRMRMTATALQLALLATRQKITDLPWLRASAGQQGAQDMAAIMDAVCALLMYPPREMDTLFMRLVIDKQHVLSDEEMSSLLRFSCNALKDNELKGMHRHTSSSGGSSDEEASGDEAPMSPLGVQMGQGSFRRRPGASVRQLARNIGRASGAPARLVQQQLSEHLLRTLERHLQALPPGTGPDRPAGVPLEGSLRQHGAHLFSMSLQALGLGAITAEVQEGRPGFCAPSILELSLQHSGGRLGTHQGDRAAGSGGRSSIKAAAAGGSATQQVLVSAAFWLDNRSGVNLVLSDLDRRVLKGLPGPGLRSTRDVHSPGLPRDCAALEANEADLSALLSNAASSVCSSDGSSAAGAAGSSSGGTAAKDSGAGAASCDDNEVEKALARLQEVRPALLNDQSWLRFWVEEHVLLPAGAKPRQKSRRTFSFSKTPASIVSGIASPAAPSPSGDGGTTPQTPSAQVTSYRSEPSSFFKIAVTGSKTDIKVKGKKCTAELAPSRRQQLTGLPSTEEEAAAEAAADAAAAQAAGSAAAELQDPQVAMVVPVQRLFEFAAEVWPTPADGPFRATKVVSIKSKYILFNDTGMALEYKQKGTPDVNHKGYKSYGKGRRFAGVLQPQERCAFHWDNINEARLLVIRPAAPGWPWSGAFPLPEREDYFGLRLRNRWSEAAIIIPVNSTVGRSGSCLITFKSTSSVPPFRIENRTKAVMVSMRQQLADRGGAGPNGHAPGPSGVSGARQEATPRSTGDAPAGWAWDSLAPGSAMPFAWDDYTARHTVEVAAAVLAPGGKSAGDVLVSSKRSMYSFDLDTFKNDSKQPHFIELRGTTRTLRSSRSSTAAAAAAAAVAATSTDDGPAGPAPTRTASAVPQMSSQQAQAVAAGAGGPWAGPEAASAAAAGQYLSDMRQASCTSGTASPSFSAQGLRIASATAQGATFAAASALSSGRAGQLQPAATMASSLASGRVPPNAAAAAGAGLRVTGGVLAVEGDVADAGLRVHYDKLTLLLDSGLPMGGNCKVTLKCARGLMPVGLSERVSGCQARLLLAGHSTAISGVVARARDQEGVSWDHEEQFTEVTALSELVIEVWGLPSQSMFSSRHGRSSRAGPRGKADGSNATGRKQDSSRAGDAAGSSSGYGSQASSLPSGSIFLGAVNIPLLQTLPNTSTASRELSWYNLMRRSGEQHVTGQVQVGFAWSFTRETLLACELTELERLLAARQEVLARLNPLSSARVARLMGLPAAAAGLFGAAGDGGAAAAAAAAGDVAAAGQGAEDDWEGSMTSDDTGDSSPLTAASPASAAQHSPRQQLLQQQQQPGSASAAASARSSIVTTPNVFSGLDLGMADSSVVSLEVGVMEVANLTPRSGWSQDLTHVLLSSAAAGSARRSLNAGGGLLLSEAVKKSDLPLPVVYVFCGPGGSKDSGVEVSSGVHSLNPVFADNLMRFQHVGMRSMLRVLVYDRRSALDSRLLGVASLPAAAVPTSSSAPVYMWLPLSPPASRGKGRLGKLQGYMPWSAHGLDAARQQLGGRVHSPHHARSGTFSPQHQHPSQVLLRVRVVKPATHNTTAALQLNLEGLQLNAKTNGGEELLNLTVSTVQCALLNTTRERQLSLSVLSMQLDNQLLETRHPVVLSPATMGEDAVMPAYHWG